MAQVILDITEEESSDDRILDRAWYGEFQLACTVYASDPVKLQFRDPGETWIDARFNGSVIQLEAAGDVLDVKLVRDRDYRLVTDTAGAKVSIAKHNIHSAD